jgi:hypothetical protein|nr:MAG TPA: tail fiber protein [Caudoviricetes sp.]
MTVSQQTPVSNWWGNNSATEFPFNFYIEKESELLVEHTDLNGVKSTLENGVDYSIHEVGNKEGSYITFPLAGSRYKTLAWDTSTDKKELLTLALTLPIEQIAEYEDSGDLSKKNLELSFDYAIRLIQILNRTISRAVKVNEGDETTPDQLIKSLNESKRIAVDAASTATSQAENAQNSANIASEKADIATVKAAEVTETYNNAMADIQKDWQDAIDEIEEKQTTAETSIINLQSTAENTISNGIADIKSNKEQSMSAIDENRISSIEEISNTKTTAISDVSTAGAEQVSNIKKTGFYMQDDKLYYINVNGETKEFIFGGGRELLEIYIDPFCDESENKGRIANGQIIAQNQFPEATKKLKKRVGWDSENKKATLNTSLVCTEEEWLAIKTASKLGQCGKFVIDDEAGTIRLPAIININGLTDLSKAGLIKDESLPNAIYYSDAGWDNNSDAASKSLVASKDGGYEINNTGKGLLLGTNQSTSPAFSYSYGKLSSNNSTYQDNAPVQQEAVQYPYVICVNTGVEEAERPINNYQVNNTNSYGDNKYVGNTILNNLSWLRSVGQENPAGVHQDFFNWAIANIGQPFGAGLIKESTATDITEYDLVINKSKQTFILPTLNGEENIISAKYSAMNINGSPYNFTAPANGWLYMSGTAVSSNNEYITVYIDKAKTTPIIGRNPLTGASITYLVPVFKGQEVIIEYTASNISRCKFIYAKGNGNLYYYIGDTLQNADLINIARMQEQITDINAQSRGYLVESYTNGTSGYRLYSDGYCEQWGYSDQDENILRTITFLKPYKDTDYVVTFGASNINDPQNQNSRIAKIQSITTTNMVVVGVYDNNILNDFHFYWRTCGYIA